MIVVSSSITYQFDELEPDLLIADMGCVGYLPEGLYDPLHLEVAVSMVPLDHVRDPLAALHPRLDQLGKHFEDPLARAHALLFEDGWGDTAELEPKVVLLPVPPPLLKIHGLHFRTEWFDFDGGVVGVVREAGGG